MVQGREVERRNIRHDVETPRMIWDEVGVQFSELDTEQRMRMCALFLTAAEMFGIVAQRSGGGYGWVMEEKGRKGKRRGRLSCSMNSIAFFSFFLLQYAATADRCFLNSTFLRRGKEFRTMPPVP